MFASELPHCQWCQHRNFRSGGSHSGGVLSQQSFTCESCGAFVQYLLYGPSGELLSFIQKSSCKEQDAYGNCTFPEAYSRWVNTVLMASWRHREEVGNDFKKREYLQWLADKFYPEFPEYIDYDPYGKNAGKPTFSDLSEKAQLFIRETWGDPFQGFWPGSYLSLPADLQTPVYPPQAPDIAGVRFMVRDPAHRTWVPLDYERSAALPVPEDPILRHNREYFDKVWAQVSSNLEQELPSRTETENGYGGIEPWYTLVLNEVVFTIGWRKRVVAVQFESGRPLDVRALRDIATADKVTYIAEGPMTLVSPDDYERAINRDFQGEGEGLRKQVVASFQNTHPNGLQMRTMDGLGHGREQAHHVQVHAWTLDKTVEYLTLLCRSAILV